MSPGGNNAPPVTRVVASSAPVRSLSLALTLAAGLSLGSACSSSDTAADSGGREDGGAAADASPAPVDSGPVPSDSGPPADAGDEPGDGGLHPDAAEVVDAGAPDAGAPDLGVADAGAGPTCGADRPAVSSIRGTEGLVIARDGTIYYSQGGGVGRLSPGGTPEGRWVRITGASTVWGLALDAANRYLYVGSPSTGSVHRIDLLASSASATAFVEDAGSPNGLTIGPDGALYFSDFGGNHVYRADTAGATATRVRVTTSPIASANGVMFLPDGTLLAASYATGALHRLTLTAGVETARAPFASGLGSADGLALDADGRVYVTDQSASRVVRLEADGTGPMTIANNIGSPANLEFGAGPLDCEDLYITSSGALVRYEGGDVPGAPVLWH